MFSNRQEAGKVLAARLTEYRAAQGRVLAIPRGGVPIGSEIAQALGWPLEVALSKKIGHPANKEYAIGAASLSGYVLNPEITVAPEYLEAELARIRENLLHYHRLYAHQQASQPYTGQMIILTDDGVATGHTMLSVMALIRAQSPRLLVVAVPVAAPEALRKISAAADQVVCLAAPEDFRSVGQFYQDFEQLSDETVAQLLQSHRQLNKP